jgi:hypothetical protein
MCGPRAHLTASRDERAGQADAWRPGDISDPVVVRRLALSPQLGIFVPPLLLPIEPPYPHAVVAPAASDALRGGTNNVFVKYSTLLIRSSEEARTRS